MYYFNIILTEKCNANCSHCYMGNRKNNLKSLSKIQVDRIINEIPKNTKKIVLTGGEIFTEKDLLMYTIRRIHEIGKIEIELESNGIYFYKNNTLEKLKEFNDKISSIRFSDDPFHKEGGVDLQKVRELKKYQPELKYEIKYLVQNKALKIGNAKKLDDNLLKKCNCMNTKETLKNPYFFLDIKGNVYLCAWKLISPIGNIFSDKMSEIIERLNISFNKKILEGEIEEAFALNNGKKEQYKEYTEKYGQCMLCEKFHKKKL